MAEEVDERSPLGRLDASYLMADFVRLVSEAYVRLDGNYSLTLTPVCTSNFGFWEVRCSRQASAEAVLVIPPEFPEGDEDD
jgi:hypothetical protein